MTVTCHPPACTHSAQVNSYNGWAEGTQIESVDADPTDEHGSCQSYDPPEKYLDATAEHAARFVKVKAARARDEL